MAAFLGIERLVHGPWQAFERALARLVEHAGFADVQIVGGSGDLGADIVGTFREQRWVIQAKFRSSGYVGEEALEEAVRASNAYSANVCVAASNQAFSEQALRARKAYEASGIDARLWDRAFLLKFVQRLPQVSRAKPALRPYQSDAIDAITRVRLDGESTALYVMATGLGKTLVAGEVVRSQLEADCDSEVLVVAHTIELVRQLERAMWRQLGKDIATHLWTDGEMPSYVGGIIFATWQSLASRATYEQMRKRFALVVVDEAHHAPSRKYRRMLKALEPSFMLGTTATPWRIDQRPTYELFGRPVFSMDIVQGMQDGYLAEVDYHMMVDDIDWDEVYRLSRQGYSIRDLNARLLMPERDDSIISRLVDEIKSLSDPRVLCFCRSIAHAEHFTRMLLAHSVSARVLHSGLARNERFKALSGFRAGEFPVLLAVDVLNEGIDLPAVNMVVFLRVTHSRRIFVQQLGRGLRIAHDKRHVKVLDFVADIRRIAAGFALNERAAQRAVNTEVLRFGDGRIVRFEGSVPSGFTDEFLRDVASLEESDDAARLIFPDY